MEIKQLTVKGIKDLQKVLDVNKNDDVAGLKTLSAIFRQTIVGAENMKDSEFENLNFDVFMLFWSQFELIL